MQNLITIIGLITAAIGASSAVLSTWITARHNEKMYKLQVLEKQRLAALESYITHAAALALSPSRENRLSYLTAYSAAYFYIPNSCLPPVRTLHDLLLAPERDNEKVLSALDEAREILRIKAL